MNKQIPPKGPPAPLGMIEPHAKLLNIPSNDQILYKIMSVENFIRCFSGSYLYFNRVDSYKDFPNSDSHDGEQFPKDRPANQSSTFRDSPDFSAADYYDQCRSRTYACCFSLENSPYIWKNYGNGGTKGKVCIVLNLGGLRKTLNATLDPQNAKLIYNGQACRQIFSVNYGAMDYVDWLTVQANENWLQNPIKYIYAKDENCYSADKELRIALFAPGIGKFALKDGSLIEFPNYLHIPFDFRQAAANGTLHHLLLSGDCDIDFFAAELQKHGIDNINISKGEVTL